jgi:hypothetical protein
MATGTGTRGRACLSSTPNNRSSSRSDRVSPQQPQLPVGINTTPVNSLPGETGLTPGGSKSRVGSATVMVLIRLIGIRGQDYDGEEE